MGSITLGSRVWVVVLNLPSDWTGSSLKAEISSEMHPNLYIIRLLNENFAGLQAIWAHSRCSVNAYRMTMTGLLCTRE